MKIVRFEFAQKRAYGIVDGDTIDIIEEEPFSGVRTTGQRVALSEVRLLSPCTPSKIIAVGLNYKDHAEELGMDLPQEPVIFLKPPTSLIGPDADIIKPPLCRRLDYEAELAMVIGKRAKDLQPKDAEQAILGFTCANDVTARDLQKKDMQWTRAKSFDTFCPAGPWIETDLDVSSLKLRLRLNDVVKQSSSTDKMIFKPYELVSFISGVMTLEPGDMILTGTPPQVGEMFPGDKVEVDIEGIGVLKNAVID